MEQNIDVMQALTMAGGLTPYASTGGIKILRRTQDKQIVMSFDYSDVEKGKRLEQNRILKSGDIVVVP
jgi:polysaccharide export outer membrane protein